MLKIGITGGIGTGKSEVCKILEESGATVLYADSIAKNLLDSDKSVKSQVKKIFGNEIYDQNDRIDRKLLAKKIFLDSNLKRQLESIVHPVVINFILKAFQEIEEKKDKTVVFVEAALIFETGFNENLNYTIVVDSDIETCIARVMKRDKVSRDDVLNRIKFQVEQKEKIKLADFVIHNNSTIDELKKNVHFIYKLLLKIAEKNYGTKGT
ncbi:MAG: Dephospho-CoA kinase [Ignavibacteriae bacterium]|nr:MAG: Dephospho-CoA kinase [Ignavibacteriota bacterium]